MHLNYSRKSGNINQSTTIQPPISAVEHELAQCATLFQKPVLHIVLEVCFLLVKIILSTKPDRRIAKKIKTDYRF